jgi:phosphatidate cytidylyltransferase
LFIVELFKRIKIGIILTVLAFLFVWIDGKSFLFFMLIIWTFVVNEILNANGIKNNLKKKIIWIIFYTILILTNIMLRHLDHGRILMMIVVITAIISDTAGYWYGKNYGKIKIFPMISPNKTLEGTFYAILMPSIVVFLLIHNHCNYSVCLSIILSMSAVIGDMLESLLKRQLGIKDSSNMLGPHGGVLDRVDSHLFVGFIFYLLTFLNFLIY